MIVGVCGYARHGKGEVGRRLVERHGFEEFQFSAALKEMALRLDPIITAYQGGWREDHHPDLERLSDLVESVGWDEAKKVTEVRRILQVLGTECVRDILGEDSWVRALARSIAPDQDLHEQLVHRDIVVTDLRFPNEASAVHSWGGVLIRIARPDFNNGVPSDHPSEAHIESLDADFEIVNDGTLEDLGRQVDRVAFTLGAGPLHGVTASKAAAAFRRFAESYGISLDLPSRGTGSEDEAFPQIERPGDAVAAGLEAPTADCG